MKFCKVCQSRITGRGTFCSQACCHEAKKGIHLPSEEEIYRMAEELRKKRPDHKEPSVEIKVYESRVYWR